MLAGKKQRDQLLMIALAVAMVISLIPAGAFAVEPLVDSPGTSVNSPQEPLAPSVGNPSDPVASPASPTTFMVKFFTEGEEIGSAQKVIQGQAAIAPENPIREGKSFTGWDQDFSNIQGDLNVNAVYAAVSNLPDESAEKDDAAKNPLNRDGGVEAIVHTITFTVGEVVSDPLEVNDGDTIPPEAIPVTAVPSDAEEGTEFLGWFDGEAEFDIAAPVVGEQAREIDLVARFGVPAKDVPKDQSSIAVQLMIGDAPYGEPIPVSAEGKIPEQPAPDPAYFPAGMVSFRGWFEQNALVPFDFANTVITQDLKLYAHFSANYLIKYKNADGLVIDTKEVESGQVIPKSSMIPLPPTGQHFVHWYEEGQDPSIPFNFGIEKATHDATLLPYFSNQWYVFFVSAGTQVDPLLVNDGTPATEPQAPTRAGYQFRHWSTSQDDSTGAYAFSTAITGNTTLYAIWDAQDTGYTIVYWFEKANIAGDAGTDTNNYEFYKSVPKTAQAGSLITLTAAGLDTIPRGYFSHSPSQTVLGNGTTVVNAYFKRTVYTLSFDLNPNNPWSGLHRQVEMKINGQTFTDDNKDRSSVRYSFTAKLGQDISNLWPSNANAEFRRWGPSCQQTAFESWDETYVSHRPTLTEELCPSGSSTTRTFEARWQKGSAYQVNYYFERLPQETGGVQYNGKWYVLNTEYSQRYYSSGSGLDPKDIDGMKCVNRDTQYGDTKNFYYDRYRGTLAFNTMGGSPIASVTDIMYGASLSTHKPADPTKPDTIFKGWYKDAECMVPFDFATGIMPIMTQDKGTLTLFAKYESTDWTVSFYDDFAGTVPSGDAVGVEDGGYLIDPGYYVVDQFYTGKGVFKGWYWFVVGQPIAFSFDTPITKDINLFAGWETSGYKVSYDLGAGTGTIPVDPDSYDIGTRAPVKPATDVIPPSGNTFVGWTVAGDPVTYYPGNTILVSGNLTLVAKYAPSSALGKVTYHANAPSVDPDVRTIEIPVVVGSTIQLLGADAFSYEGYTLIGWTDSPNSTEVKFALGSEFLVVDQLTHFYGVWKKNKIDIELTITGNNREAEYTSAEFTASGFDWDAASKAAGIRVDLKQGMQAIATRTEVGQTNMNLTEAHFDITVPDTYHVTKVTVVDGYMRVTPAHISGTLNLTGGTGVYKYNGTPAHTIADAVANITGTYRIEYSWKASSDAGWSAWSAAKPSFQEVENYSIKARAVGTGNYADDPPTYLESNTVTFTVTPYPVEVVLTATPSSVRFGTAPTSIGYSWAMASAPRTWIDILDTSAGFANESAIAVTSSYAVDTPAGTTLDLFYNTPPILKANKYGKYNYSYSSSGLLTVINTDMEGTFTLSDGGGVYKDQESYGATLNNGITKPTATTVTYRWGMSSDPSTWTSSWSANKPAFEDVGVYYVQAKASASSFEDFLSNVARVTITPAKLRLILTASPNPIDYGTNPSTILYSWKMDTAATWRNGDYDGFVTDPVVTSAFTPTTNAGQTLDLSLSTPPVLKKNQNGTPNYTYDFSGTLTVQAAYLQGTLVLEGDSDVYTALAEHFATVKEESGFNGTHTISYQYKTLNDSDWQDSAVSPRFEEVGSYLVRAIATPTTPNYKGSVISDSVQVNIAPADLAVTPLATPATVAYGTEPGSVSYSYTVSTWLKGKYDGFVVDPVVTSSYTAGATVGTPVALSFSTVPVLKDNPYGKPNYRLVLGTGNLGITPRAVTLTANSFIITEGSPDPVFTANVTAGNLIGSDVLDYTFTRAAGTAPGGYAIDIVLGNNPNYAITPVSGLLTIQGAAIPIVTPTPDTPVPAPAPAPAPGAAETEPPVIADTETPTARPPASSQIEDEGNPLASSSVWALWNLILAIATGLIMLVLLIGYFVGKKRKEDSTESEDQSELKRKGIFRLISIVVTAIAVIAFILTEDMSNSMVMVDQWTWLMAIVAVVQVVVAVFAVKSRKKDEDQMDSARVVEA